MRLLSVLLAAASLVAFAAPVVAGKAPLQDPAPVVVPSGLTAEQVTKDIKRALLGRGWTIANEQPGRIDATLHLREHVANIRITRDAGQVKFAYVDSENLDYAEKKGVRYIHSNYLGWIGFLINDLSANMEVSRQGG